jgi:2',3'-cyclic-nucleotide 2'-phosphodiesterase (5'-nucleotidase family)
MPLTLQLFHASDLEGGVEAIGRAPNFAAIIDRLEDDYTNTIVISAGDNYIPGPFFNAAADSSLRTSLRNATGNSDARESEGRADIAIMNAIGFDASAFGNHEFDAGTSTIAGLIGTDIRDSNDDGVLDDSRWLGTQFPYLSANLDFSGDSNLSRLFTNSVLDSTAFQSPLTDLSAASKAPKIAPLTIVDADGIASTIDDRIGVVGGTTPLLDSISSPGDTAVKNPGAGTNDMAALAAILQPEIDRLKAVGINKIVVATHLQQIQLEQQLVPLLRDVDIVIAGGSDTLLADGTDTLNPGDVAGGNYPLFVNSADGSPTAIVSTDGQYSYVGRLVVTFDDNGVIVPSSVDPAISGAYATTDAVVQSLWGGVDPFASGTKGNLVKQVTDAVQGVVVSKDSNIFGSANVFLEGRRTEIRTQETNMGNITADANLFYAKSVDPTVTVSIKNGGGIRNPIGEVVETQPGVYEPQPSQPNPLTGKQLGQVSQLDIENTLRFNNGLTLLTVTALELKQILEHGVAATKDGATPGQFPQVSGIAFSFDPTQTAIVFDDNNNVVTDGQRIRSLAIKNPDGTNLDVIVRDGQLVGDPNRPIRLVTLNFLADGGDSYPFDTFGENRVDLVQEDVRNGAATFADTGSEQDALAEYLAARFATTPYALDELDPEFDRRIQNLAERSDTVLGLGLLGTNRGDRLRGDVENDTILGEGGNDNIKGLAGDDILNGGKGRDRISGGAGNDFIYGSPSIDIVFGNDGDDTFVLTEDTGVLVIADFQSGSDTIALGEGVRLGNLRQELDSVFGRSGVIINAGNKPIAFLVGKDSLLGRRDLNRDELPEVVAEEPNFAPIV